MQFMEGFDEYWSNSRIICYHSNGHIHHSSILQTLQSIKALNYPRIYGYNEI